MIEFAGKWYEITKQRTARKLSAKLKNGRAEVDPWVAFEHEESGEVRVHPKNPNVKIIWQNE